MEAILSFMFDNPFLTIILLFFLFSMLGRTGRKGGGNRMPDFGGGPGGWPAPGRGMPSGSGRSGEMRGRTDLSRRPERRDAGGGEPAFPREWRPAQPQEARERMADPRPVRMEPSPPAASPAASASTAAHEAADSASAAIDGASRVAPALQVERASGRPIAGQEELRQAVLWAEILGPPRARSPHGRRRIGR